MNAQACIGPCPSCLGKGHIRIADFVENQLVPDRPIQCPACEGLGTARTLRAASESHGD